MAAYLVFFAFALEMHVGQHFVSFAVPGSTHTLSVEAGWIAPVHWAWPTTEARAGPMRPDAERRRGEHMLNLHRYNETAQQRSTDCGGPNDRLPHWLVPSPRPFRQRMVYRGETRFSFVRKTLDAALC